MDAKAILEKIKLLEIKTKSLSKQVFSGEYHSAFKGRGMTFSEVREYQTGDEIRTIDWNVTARFNEPFVKVFEEERELNVVLVVDVSGSQNYGIHEKSKKELALELAAVLAFSAISNNDKVGAIFYSDKMEKYIPSKKGRKHALVILRELSEQKTEGKGTNVVEALKFLRNTEKKRSIVFVISDFIDEHPFIEALSHTRKRHDVVAIKISDPLEQELPNLGIVPLQDAETGEWNWYNTGSAEFRKEFNEIQENNRLKFSSDLRKRGIDSIEISTQDDYYRTLVQLFHKRKP
ncbi:MAG: DUF58 domain-containing protein [Crocinitomicaceae bacterium]